MCAVVCRARNMRLCAPILLYSLACGGLTATDPDAGGSIDSDVTANCLAANGDSICGAACAPCAECAFPTTDSANVLQICNAEEAGAGCNYSNDGRLCARVTSAELPTSDLRLILAYFDNVDPAIGKLYASNARDDLVKFADRATYDGVDLPPAPLTCPSTPDLPLCGGACGACPNPTYPTTDYVCMGRSPKHPYSICVNQSATNMSCQRTSSNAAGPCPTSLGNFSCFTFAVDEAAQPLADANSLLIDSKACAAAQQSYPGGAFCTCPFSP